MEEDLQAVVPEKFSCNVEALAGQNLEVLITCAKFIRFPDIEQLRNMELAEIPGVLDNWLARKIIPEQSQKFPPLAIFTILFLIHIL